MLFLGVIVTIMEGCGLAETMKMIYAPNSVVHMLEVGKQSLCESSKVSLVYINGVTSSK